MYKEMNSLVYAALTRSPVFAAIKQVMVPVLLRAVIPSRARLLSRVRHTVGAAAEGSPIITSS